MQRVTSVSPREGSRSRPGLCPDLIEPQGIVDAVGRDREPQRGEREGGVAPERGLVLADGGGIVVSTKRGLSGEISPQRGERRRRPLAKALFFSRFSDEELDCELVYDRGDAIGRPLDGGLAGNRPARDAQNRRAHDDSCRRSNDAADHDAFRTKPRGKANDRVSRNIH